MDTSVFKNSSAPELLDTSFYSILFSLNINSQNELQNIFSYNLLFKFFFFPKSTAFKRRVILCFVRKSARYLHCFLCPRKENPLDSV